MSVLLKQGDRALFLDAGSGLGRLVESELAVLLSGVRQLDIVLTHYHLDHLSGLPALHRLAAGRPIRIHAPAPPLVDGDPSSLFELIRPPFFPVPLASWPHPVEVRPVAVSELEIGGFRLRFRRQPHPGGSVGIRVGDELAYLTDTAFEPESASFAEGVKLLLHEAWALEADADPGSLDRSGHTSAAGAGRIAEAARVDRLALVHHPPWADRTTLEGFAAEAAGETRAAVAVLDEGRPLPLGS